MATSTLRCLTLFSVKPSELKLRSTIFSLGRYELSDRRWNNRLSVNMSGQLKNMILDKSIAVLNNKMRNLLFHIEFLINDGACLIHEGNRAPGRCVKNSLIHREMVKELTSDNLCVLTGDCHNNCNNKHHLTFGDVTRMNCIIEHDRMLYNGCDRQHLLFSDDQVDEFEFVQSCKNVGWTVFPAVNNCLMIGGLRSLCLNSSVDRDGVNRVGACLRSFDGIFEYERDKEYFYLEHSIRLVCHNSSAKKSTLFDPVGACRITRLPANIRRILDEHGREHAPKSRSSVKVDEDFWYMRGRYKLCTTNDEPTNEEGWPYSSIFHTRSENAIPLNANLSKTASNATYDQTKVENLKSLLFKDCRDSRTEFINLRTNGRPSDVGEKETRTTRLLFVLVQTV